MDGFFDVVKEGPKPLYLEIGAGKGAFMRAMSEMLEGTYLCLERDLSTAATLARTYIEEGRKGAYLVNGDFDFAKEKIEPNSIRYVFLNFPDPWPKKKHGPRRLCAPSRLEAMAKLLEIGGEIRLKTDSQAFYLEALENYPTELLKVRYQTENYLGDDVEDAATEYENKKRAEGLPIYRLILKRKDNGK